MSRVKPYSNGVPNFGQQPYVQWDGLYVQYNPFIPSTFNYPKPAQPPQSLWALLSEEKAGGTPCTDRQASQMCSTVVTNKGQVCAGFGSLIDMGTGRVSLKCPVD